MSNSKYFQEFDAKAQKRYKEKLHVARLSEDPYVSRKFVSASYELWPGIKYPDICNYLIHTASIYTKEELKAYKSMDGYNFFIQGWISKIDVVVTDKAVVLKANVRHSQSVYSPLLHPWVAAEKYGTILCVHCTCMAGLVEACAYTAAVLFLAEAKQYNEEKYIVHFSFLFLDSTNL